MTASLYDRACCFGDWENDGGSINPGALGIALCLYADDTVDTDYVIDNCRSDGESALTSAQEGDVADVVATRPAALLTAVNAFARASWARRIEAILWAGREQRPGFTTEAAVKTALGV